MNEKIKPPADSIIKPEWSLEIPKEETAEAARILNTAIEQDKFKEMLEILHDPVVLRSFSVRRGQGSEYLKLFVKSLEYLIRKKYGENRNSQDPEIDGEKLFALVGEHDLEAWLIKLYGAAYHLRDQKLKDKVITAITENAYGFKDQSLVAEAYHDTATYKMSAENNPVQAGGYNRLALEKARENNDANMLTKIRFGLTYSKDAILSPAEREKSFREYGEKFTQLGNLPDAGRANIELARALTEKAAWQRFNQPELSGQSLAEAEVLARKELAYSRRLPYPNLEILSLWVLGHVKELKGDMAAAASLKSDAVKKKKVYGYKSELPEFKLPSIAKK
ncbi:MAG: hypothetical protein MUC28_02005 [Planctomycetes bacterium]|nr:hypothetical protein [Planctomycetota bacterium]